MEKNKPKSRAELLSDYYALVIYTLKIAGYCCEMAVDFADHSKIKHNLNLTRNAAEAKIRDLVHILKQDSKQDMLNDLNSDDLQALGAILQELIHSPGISPIEGQLIQTIRKLKKEMHAKLESEAAAGVEA